MKLRLKIWWLKRKLRKHYIAYCDIRDSYSCGAHLAGYVSADLCRHRDTFNKLSKKLQEIDPDAPDMTLA